MPSVERVLVSLKCLVSANFLGFSVLVCLIANDIAKHAVLLVLIKILFFEQWLYERRF